MEDAAASANCDPISCLTRVGVNSAVAAAEGVEPETGAIGGIAIMAAGAAEVEVAAPELGLKATAGAVNSAAGVVAEDGGEPEAWATGGFEMLAAGTAKDEKVATELRLRAAAGAEKRTATAIFGAAAPVSAADLASATAFS